MPEMGPESALPRKHIASVTSIERSSELLNYQEAARFLRISRGTLENWISSGLYDVPHIKVGRLIRFRTSSLSRWLESRERGKSQLTKSAP
jgi:excisionase family DNA binding protein